ncbi:MAG TPA: hypothetical protein H9862_01000, partial [Candidatus Akkermansia intestinigallinarum]|nr:hypothetical protein [Candidatus Akkermansia intestinigallinarum]
LLLSYTRVCNNYGDFSFEATIKMPLRRFSPESFFGAFYFDAMRIVSSGAAKRILSLAFAAETW